MYEKEEQLELWQHLWSAYYTSGANLRASRYELIFATILLGFFHQPYFSNFNDLTRIQISQFLYQLCINFPQSSADSSCSLCQDFFYYSYLETFCCYSTGAELFCFLYVFTLFVIHICFYFFNHCDIFVDFSLSFCAISSSLPRFTHLCLLLL